MSEKDFPTAIGSEYRLGNAGDAIELHRGPIELDWGSGIERRDAVVVLEWLPSPHIAINSRGPLSPLKLDSSRSLCVKFLSLESQFNALVVRFDGSPDDCLVSLMPTSHVSIGTSQEFASVVFHIVNLGEYHGGEHVMHRREDGFAMANRVVLDAEGWRITFDSVEGQDEVIRSLRHRGGHAITYVGRMERTDGTLIGSSDVEDVTGFLVSFLSFLNGDRCSIVLPVAYDSASREVWRGWNAGCNAPWIGKANWSKDLPARWLSQAFPGFLRRWLDPDWQEAVGLAIEWYLQGKRGKAETALLLGQSALELLGWVQFVESSGRTMSGGTSTDCKPPNEFGSY
jgi:hypothetical protein